MSATLIAMGTLKAVGGVLGGMSASQTASAQADLMQQRYEFNVKQQEKAYKENYSKTMLRYAEQRRDYISKSQEQIGEATAQLSTAQSDVDMAGTSYSGDKLGELDDKLSRDIQTLSTNQTEALDSLSEQKYNSLVGLNSQYSDQSTQLALQTDSAKKSAMSSVATGVTTVGLQYEPLAEWVTSAFAIGGE